MKDFQAANGNQKTVNNVEFDAEILTNSHWPFEDAPKLKIP